MVASIATSILDRVIEPRSADLPPEAARAFLRFAFRESDQARMTELATKSRQGTISDAELEELEGYAEIGLLIDLLKSKARLSLKHAPAAGG